MVKVPRVAKARVPAYFKVKIPAATKVTVPAVAITNEVKTLLPPRSRSRGCRHHRSQVPCCHQGQGPAVAITNEAKVLLLPRSKSCCCHHHRGQVTSKFPKKLLQSSPQSPLKAPKVPNSHSPQALKTAIYRNHLGEAPTTPEVNVSDVSAEGKVPEATAPAPTEVPPGGNPAPTIFLVQPDTRPGTRTYADYESINECMEGVCKIYEEQLNMTNPNTPHHLRCQSIV